ncbi:MAG: hypothetical protein JNM10_01620, partial [Planctomycetia bacterium]|nr:hypothetical protein [Planctomycetia bacterium]
MKWSCAALVAVLLVRGAAFAADAPPAPPPPAPGPPAPAPGSPVPAPGSPPAAPDAGAVAARVVAAFDAHDDVALRALAESDTPDPWIVADLVLAQGRADVAEAFAKAAPRADVEALPGYVASRRGVADAPARREALARANAALGAQRGDVALEAAGPRDEGPIADVVGVRLEMTRGFGHRLAGAPDAAEPAFLAVAEAAARIGWLAREGAALDEAGKAAYAAQRLDAARGAWTRMREVAERRGRRAAVAVASALVGDCSREMGDLPAAAAAIEAGLAAEADAPGALEAFGGPERLRTLHGRVLLDLGR